MAILGMINSQLKIKLYDGMSIPLRTFHATNRQLGPQLTHQVDGGHISQHVTPKTQNQRGCLNISWKDVQMTLAKKKKRSILL